METASCAAPQRKTARVLLIDPDPRARSILAHILRERAHSTDSVDDTAVAAQRLESAAYDVVLLDSDTAGYRPLLDLAATGRFGEATRWIVLGKTAVDGFESVIKPFGSEELFDAIERAPPVALDLNNPRRRLVGRSPDMQAMIALIEQVAPTRATVLIQGETGTGKELVARTLHDLSPRAARPFVPVNCSALPETLLESELFGHTRGSFTGAIAERRGLLEYAAGGTLFLDEVSGLSPAIQVKLLRVLQERVIQPVGSNVQRPVDFRLVAATNTNLATEVAAGRFREDLYYRLHVFPIIVPPLRDRKGDIPLLISHFRLKFSEEIGLVAPAVDSATLVQLSEYDWPGNVRELESFVERAVIMRTVTPPRSASVATPLLETAHTEHWTLARLEHHYIEEVLKACGGHRAHAARILGIDQRTLYRRLKTWT